MGFQKINHSLAIGSTIHIQTRDLNLDTNTPLPDNYNDTIQRRLHGAIVGFYMHSLFDQDLTRLLCRYLKGIAFNGISVERQFSAKFLQLSLINLMSKWIVEILLFKQDQRHVLNLLQMTNKKIFTSLV